MQGQEQRSRAAWVRELTRRIQELEGPAAGRARRSREASEAKGDALWEWLFPSGQIPRGALVEWLGDASGAWSLALQAAHRLLGSEGILVVIDAGGGTHLYTPAMARLGIDLRRVLLVCPERNRDRLWALEQALRCPAVSVVFCRMGLEESRVYRRLQLAAEGGGTLGWLARPVVAQRQPCWAWERFLVRGVVLQPSASNRFWRRLRLERLHDRGAWSGRTIEVEVEDETGIVRVVSELSDSAAVARPTGPEGPGMRALR